MSARSDHNGRGGSRCSIAGQLERTAISKDDKEAFLSFSTHGASHLISRVSSASRRTSRSYERTKPCDHKLHLAVLCNRMNGKEIAQLNQVINPETMHLFVFTKGGPFNFRAPTFQQVKAPSTVGIGSAVTRQQTSTDVPRCPALAIHRPPQTPKKRSEARKSKGNSPSKNEDEGSSSEDEVADHLEDLKPELCSKFSACPPRTNSARARIQQRPQSCATCLSVRAELESMEKRVNQGAAEEKGETARQKLQERIALDRMSKFYANRTNILQPATVTDLFQSICRLRAVEDLLNQLPALARSEIFANVSFEGKSGKDLRELLCELLQTFRRKEDTPNELRETINFTQFGHMTGAGCTAAPTPGLSGYRLKDQYAKVSIPAVPLQPIMSASAMAAAQAHMPTAADALFRQFMNQYSESEETDSKRSVLKLSSLLTIATAIGCKRQDSLHTHSFTYGVLFASFMLSIEPRHLVPMFELHMLRDLLDSRLKVECSECGPPLSQTLLDLIDRMKILTQLFQGAAMEGNLWRRSDVREKILSLFPLRTLYQKKY